MQDAPRELECTGPEFGYDANWRKGKIMCKPFESSMVWAIVACITVMQDAPRELERTGSVVGYDAGQRKVSVSFLIAVWYGPWGKEFYNVRCSQGEKVL
jgi:hypothetical protein